MTTSDVAPKRIQRKRSKDWRMPDGAVYVEGYDFGLQDGRNDVRRGSVVADTNQEQQ